MYREDENRQYSQEFEKLNSEITALKVNEVALLKNIDELKENLLIVSNECDDIREQNDNYQNELENIQRLLYDETESGSKSASKVILLVRQLDEEQQRANVSINQLNDAQMQLKSALMTNDTLKSELNQARLLIQEHTIKVKIIYLYFI
jgi:predicted  nucleic acid-binding Zn-ribbon protein